MIHRLPINMGCVSARFRRQSVENSRRLDKQIKKDALRSTKDIKLLLLGTDQAAKLMLLNKLKVIQSDSYLKRGTLDKYQYNADLDTVPELVRIIHAMAMLKIPFSDPTREKDTMLVQNFASSKSDSIRSNSELLEAIYRLWIDPGVKLYFNQFNEYELHETPQLKNELSNYGEALNRSLGNLNVKEINLPIKNYTLRIFDLNNEQIGWKKLLYFFEDVIALLYMIDLAGYDEVSKNDPNKTALQESLRYFEIFCSSKWFTTTPIICVFSNIEVLAGKIRKNSSDKVYQEFALLHQYSDLSAGIKEIFISRINNSKKRFHCHFINDDNEKNLLNFVAGTINDILVTNQLQYNGLC